MASLHSWRAHAAGPAAESSDFRFLRGTDSRTVPCRRPAPIPRTDSQHPYQYRWCSNRYRSPAACARAALCLRRTNRQLSLPHSRRMFSAACPLRTAAGCIQSSPPLPHGRRQNSALPCDTLPSKSRGQALRCLCVCCTNCHTRLRNPPWHPYEQCVFPHNRTVYFCKICTQAK